MTGQEILQMIQADLQGSIVTGGPMNPRYMIGFSTEKQIDGINHEVYWRIFPNRVSRTDYHGSERDWQSWDIDNIALFLEPHVIFHHSPRPYQFPYWKSEG